MCSSMLLVVQSTIVTASIVRGSAPRPITISLFLTRSWASAGAASATTTRTTVTARKKERIGSPFVSTTRGRREPRVASDGYTGLRLVSTTRGRREPRVASDGYTGLRLVSTTRGRREPRVASDGYTGLLLNAKLRIERVAEPVAEEVHAERRQRQRRARKGGQPPRDVEEVAALGQHRAPRGSGRLNAEAEE